MPTPAGWQPEERLSDGKVGGKVEWWPARSPRWLALVIKGRSFSTQRYPAEVPLSFQSSLCSLALVSGSKRDPCVLQNNLV